MLPSDTALLDDLAEVVDDIRSQYPRLPLILLGHSLGGLVVSRFVSLGIRPVTALVLSSPALDARLGFFQKSLLASFLVLKCMKTSTPLRFLILTRFSLDTH